MAKNKYSIELKIEIAKAYLDGKGSYYSLAQKYNVGRKSVEVWVQKYREHGESAFYKKPGNAKYSSEFKMMCVEKVLSGVEALMILSLNTIYPLEVFYYLGFQSIMLI